MILVQIIYGVDVNSYLLNYIYYNMFNNKVLWRIQVGRMGLEAFISHHRNQKTFLKGTQLFQCLTDLLWNSAGDVIERRMVISVTAWLGNNWGGKSGTLNKCFVTVGVSFLLADWEFPPDQQPPWEFLVLSVLELSLLFVFFIYFPASCSYSLGT